VSVPSDPLDALKWALDHVGDGGWVLGAIAVGIAWTSKRVRDWGRRNAMPLGAPQARPKAAKAMPMPTVVQWSTDAATPPPPAPAAAVRPAGPASYTAAAAYTAAAYTAAAYAAQPAYAAPPAAAAAHGGHSRKPHREAAPAQRAAAPVSQPVAAHVPSGGWSLSGAFGDPAHARTAIVIAEVLGPPVGLR
jgi:hypothetical protein